MILKLLKLDKWYGVSEAIDVAKGKNKIPTSVKEGVDQIKRDARGKFQD